MLVPILKSRGLLFLLIAANISPLHTEVPFEAHPVTFWEALYPDTQGRIKEIGKTLRSEKSLGRFPSLTLQMLARAYILDPHYFAPTNFVLQEYRELLFAMEKQRTEPDDALERARFHRDRRVEAFFRLDAPGFKQGCLDEDHFRSQHLAEFGKVYRPSSGVIRSVGYYEGIRYATRLWCTKMLIYLQSTSANPAPLPWTVEKLIASNSWRESPATHVLGVERLMLTIIANRPDLFCKEISADLNGSNSSGRREIFLSKEVTGILFRYFRRLDYWLDEEFRIILDQQEVKVTAEVPSCLLVSLDGECKQE